MSALMLFSILLSISITSIACASHASLEDIEQEQKQKCVSSIETPGAIVLGEHLREENQRPDGASMNPNGTAFSTKRVTKAYTSNDELKRALQDKTVLILGGIGKNALLCHSSDIGGVSANTFSEVSIEPHMLRVNIQKEADAHLIGNAWDWLAITTAFPSLEKHQFAEIRWNHIGHGLWVALFSREERSELLKADSSLQTDTIRCRIKAQLDPLVRNLKAGGVFEYKSFVNDFLEESFDDLELDGLSLETLESVRPLRYAYPFSWHQNPHEIVTSYNDAYPLNGVRGAMANSPIIQGIEQGLIALGLQNVRIEFVVSAWPRETKDQECPPPTLRETILNINDWHRFKEHHTPSEGNQMLKCEKKKGADFFLRICATK